MSLFGSKYNKETKAIEITIDQKECVSCTYSIHGDHPLAGQIYTQEYPDMFFNVDTRLLYFKLKVGHKYFVKANIPENFEFPHVGRIVEILREMV